MTKPRRRATSDIGPQERHQNGDVVDAEFVAARLEEAAETLKKIPFPRNGKPSQIRSNMPEYRREYWELMNSMNVLERDAWERDHNETRLLPSPAEIDRMDECLRWVFMIQNPECRKIVWALALGMGLRSVGRIVGKSHEWVRVTSQKSHSEIAGILAQSSDTVKP